MTETKNYVTEHHSKPQQLISVITVVFNGENSLEKTIKSVISQSYDHVEYIIIDGGSTDGTVDIIKRYEDQIDYWISEKDEGIYDAMNKGIRQATGEWVNFMNAGDSFVNKDVLSSVDFGALSEYALIYGNRVQEGIVAVPQNITALEAGVIHANHQSMFFNRAVLRGELYYDTRYKVYADYELVNRIYLKSSQAIKYIDVNIADFEPGGVSSVVSQQKRKDKYRIVYRHYGFTGLFKAVMHRLLHR